MATNNAVNASPALSTTGGTMTGNLILNSNPTLALQACTQNYANSLVLEQPISIPGLTGNWYFSGSFLSQITNSATSYVVNTGALNYVPFLITKATIYTDIGIVIGLTASGTSVCGIYRDNGNAKPIGDPISFSNTPSLNNVANTLSGHTFSTPITLYPGLYWLAFTVSATNTVLGPSSLSLMAPPGLGMTTTPSVATLAGTGVQVGWTESFVYNATLPTAGSLTALVNTTAATSMFGYVCLKAQ